MNVALDASQLAIIREALHRRITALHEGAATCSHLTGETGPGSACRLLLDDAANVGKVLDALPHAMPAGVL